MKSTNAVELRSWLDEVLAGVSTDSDNPEAPPSLQELAVVDVREPGQFGEGHLFFAIPIPFSLFETRFCELVPRLSTRTVLIDHGDGVADLAASAATALGYTDIHVLQGGVQAWMEAGFNLFKGVNVPSKTFGELLELAHKTPHISAEELNKRQKAGETLTIIDGRPGSEYRNMSIPGADCCPNGELVMRADTLVDNPDTPVVINCAGRTRSILGAQSLIDAGFPNPVVALENGTQGWVLAGLKLDHGKEPAQVSVSEPSVLASRRDRVRQLAAKAGVEFIGVGRLAEFYADRHRTVYMFDVRSLEEFQTAALAGSRHAPGGQLVQATDQWMAVRGARVVLLDSDGLRAPMCAYWLRQLGHEAFVMQPEYTVEQLVACAETKPFKAASSTGLPLDDCRLVAVAELAESVKNTGNDYQVIDLRPSADYRHGHISGALWSVRPLVGRLELEKNKPVLLVGDQQKANLVSSDLQAGGFRCFRLAGSGESLAHDEWKSVGVPLTDSATTPADEERIDYLFFTAGRHRGNRADSLLYLEWEQDLLNQIDSQERNSFQLI